ncbi:hypothetical protein [Streptococcus cuniculi]|uniref:Uncharacterized protein n=1 Tax=Streptococcus cuniculi TaxID=1432788 RepID=A0A4Y9JEQ7_9STRE|nr:hypothetical protein [Streptococcus cuniculi]MBF0777450.1 hypothetical protein [Streptococcus cuniculi]TFU98506.1 hypothetical protein E4T82_01690 [Streptococcus cuniculi]
MNQELQDQYEEEHYRNLRYLEEAETLIEDYTRKARRDTEALVASVVSFYQRTGEGVPSDVMGKFEQVSEEYSQTLNQMQWDLEDARDEERREFYRKLEE